jgi:hypothetical protein
VAGHRASGASCPILVYSDIWPFMFRLTPLGFPNPARTPLIGKWHERHQVRIQRNPGESATATSIKAEAVAVITISLRLSKIFPSGTTSSRLKA